MSDEGFEQTLEVWASGVRVGDLVDGIPVTETMDGMPGFFWFRTDDGTWWQCTDDQKVTVQRRAVDDDRNDPLIGRPQYE